MSARRCCASCRRPLREARTGLSCARCGPVVVWLVLDGAGNVLGAANADEAVMVPGLAAAALLAGVLAAEAVRRPAERRPGA